MPSISYIVLTKDSPNVTGLIDLLLAHKDSDDEILILDDHSKDITPYEKYKNVQNVHFWQHRLLHSYSQHRNWVLSLARNDYVFYLDSDETVTEYLLANVKRFLETNQPDLVWLPRRNLITDTAKGAVDYFAWPDYQGRIIRRLSGLKWHGNLHERVKASPLDRVQQLPAFSKWAIVHTKTEAKLKADNAHYHKNYTEAENRGQHET